MKYKQMSEMTKDEIEYILKEVIGLDFNSIETIEYDKENNSIDITVTETWNTLDDDNNEVLYEDTEDITFNDDSCNVQHSNIYTYDYMQYLLAKGYHYLWKDNKYI